jgi:hypothetical protein
MQFEEAKALFAALEREGVRYVLVGAMAMAAHDLVRATKDGLPQASRFGRRRLVCCT